MTQPCGKESRQNKEEKESPGREKDTHMERQGLQAQTEARSRRGSLVGCYWRERSWNNAIGLQAANLPR